jgi:cytochrome c oxidase subunit 2
MEVDCVGRQWMWKFQHPEGNAEINDLHVPLNQPVKVRLISEDVIHSMYVPAFRIKHDVLPGRYTYLWFTATKPGKYHLFCAEYCGAKHSEMRGYVHVMEPADYQAWLSGAASGVSASEAGKLLFEQLRCNNCHQGGGTTSRGPPLENLFGSSVKLKDGGTVLADENYLRESILRPNAKVVAGYQSIMPSFEGQISEEGILHLLAYVKSLSQTKGQTTPIPAADSAAEPESQPATDEHEKRTSPE